MIKEELLYNKDEYLILKFQNGYPPNYHYKYIVKIINCSWNRISFSGFWNNKSGKISESKDHLSIPRYRITSLRKCHINEKFAVELNLWKRFLKKK